METNLTKIEKENLGLELIYEMLELTGESISSVFKWLNEVLPENLPFSRASAYNNMKKVLNEDTATRNKMLNKMESELRIRVLQIPTQFKQDGKHGSVQIMTFVCYYDVKTCYLWIEFGMVGKQLIEDNYREENEEFPVTRTELKEFIIEHQKKLGLPIASVLLTNRMAANLVHPIYYDLLKNKFYKRQTKFKPGTNVAVTPKNRFQIRIEQNDKSKITATFKKIIPFTTHYTEKQFIKLLRDVIEKHNTKHALLKFETRKNEIYAMKQNEKIFSDKERLYGLAIADITKFTELPKAVVDGLEDDES
jgi:hypothetical protein